MNPALFYLFLYSEGFLSYFLHSQSIEILSIYWFVPNLRNKTNTWATSINGLFLLLFNLEYFIN